MYMNCMERVLPSEDNDAEKRGKYTYTNYNAISLTPRRTHMTLVVRRYIYIVVVINVVVVWFP